MDNSDIGEQSVEKCQNNDSNCGDGGDEKEKVADDSETVKGWKLFSYLNLKNLSNIDPIPPKATTDQLLSFWKLLSSDFKERIMLYGHFLATSVGASEHFWWIKSEFMLILRHVFVEIDANDGGDGERRLRRSFAALAAFDNVRNRENQEIERKWLSEIGAMSSMDLEIGCTRSMISFGKMGARIPDGATETQRARFRLIIRSVCRELYDIVQGAFVIWSIRRHSPTEENTSKLLRWFNVVLIELKQEWRDAILKIVNEPKTDGGSRLSYLQRLANLIGVKKFEFIAFGKLKACGHCGATNRQKKLRVCRRCNGNRVRPKQRYCSDECHREDWPKHRESHEQLEKGVGIVGDTV